MPSKQLLQCFIVGDTGVGKTALIQTHITTITNMGVSGGTVFATTRDTSTVVTGNAETPAGTFTLTAGTVSTVSSAAVVASVITITASAAVTVTVTVVNGGVSYGTPTGGGSIVGNIITFSAAGTVVVSGTDANTQFTVSATATGIVTLTGATAGATSTGADPNWTVQLANLAAAEVDTLSTDTVITGLPTTGISVAFTGVGNYAAGTGTITFASAGEVATVTNTGTTTLATFNASAAYTVGAGANTAGSVPKLDAWPSGQ